MLKEIAIITISVSQLGPVEKAYQEYLGYETVEAATVSEELADLWQAPLMTEKNYILMRPSKMAPVYLRFVENDPVDSYAPKQTYGWNAFELAVKSPDALVPHLEGSPFEVLGPPKDLYPTEGAPRVMQVRGPADEIIYMTRPAGGGKVDKYHDTFVGRSFIVVNGGPSMSKMQDYYGKNYDMVSSPPQDYAITIISRLNDKPLDTTYPLSIVPLPSGSLIELDEYPKWARERETTAGHLPPGIASVSFTANNLDLVKARWVSEPRVVEAAPYNGRRVGIVLGAAGEWIELIEDQDAMAEELPVAE